MANEHELIPQNGELLHPEGHPMLGYRVFNLLAAVVQHKADLGLPEKWNRNYELGKNKHWRQTSKKAALVSANLLFTHRTRTVNMLTDNNPVFNIKATGAIEAAKEDIYNALMKCAEWWWHDQEQQALLEETVINGETYGLTVEKMLFNPDLEQGLGEVETVIVDPFHFGWWPLKQNKLAKCEAVFHYYPMTVREARRLWPKHAEKIKSDKELLDKLADNRMEVQANSTRRNAGGYMTNFANAVKHVLNLAGGGSGKEEGDEVLVCECWVKDYSRAADGEKEFDLYPGNIRRVTVLNGGELVVDDRGNPSINPNLQAEQASQTYCWDRFPFIKVHSVTDTGNPWGMSDFEQLEMLNIEVNKTLSQFTLVKDRMARVKLINPKDSGVSNSELTNAPGIINPSNALTSQAIRYLDGPKVDIDMIQALSVYKEFFFLVSGSFDLEQADNTGKNVIAYKAIAALLERASTMLRGKIRNYSRLIRERGRLYLALMQNWYDTERFISYEQDGDEITAAINGHEMIIPAKLGVVSGSTMPVSKIQEREEALSLFERGAIDNEELLKKIDWQDWKQVIARMKAGPIGEFIEKLSLMGFPPTLLAALGEIGNMEFKDFEQALEKGEIPQLAELLVPPEGEEGMPEGPQSTPLEQGEVAKVAAETEKVKAEAALIAEKINTERVNQAATAAGVQFDKAKLTQDQAKLISDIKNQERAANVNEYGAAAKVATEKGKLDLGEKKAKTDEKKVQGPYREKGMKSNNKQKPGGKR